MIAPTFYKYFLVTTWRTGSVITCTVILSLSVPTSTPAIPASTSITISISVPASAWAVITTGSPICKAEQKTHTYITFPVDPPYKGPNGKQTFKGRHAERLYCNLNRFGINGHKWDRQTNRQTSLTSRVSSWASPVIPLSAFFRWPRVTSVAWPTPTSSPIRWLAPPSLWISASRWVAIPL